MHPDRFEGRRLDSIDMTDLTKPHSFIQTTKNFGSKPQRKVESDEGDTIQNSLLRGIIYCLMALIVLLIVTTLSGCALTPGLVPGMGGKDLVVHEYESIDTDGSSIRMYDKAQGPAGVKNDSEVTTNTGVAPDGSWHLTRNGRITQDTQGQADMLTAVAAMNAQVLQALVEGIVNAIPGLINALPGIIAAQNPPQPPAEPLPPLVFPKVQP